MSALETLRARTGVSPRVGKPGAVLGHLRGNRLPGSYSALGGRMDWPSLGSHAASFPCIVLMPSSVMVWGERWTRGFLRCAPHAPSCLAVRVPEPRAPGCPTVDQHLAFSTGCSPEPRGRGPGAARTRARGADGAAAGLRHPGPAPWPTYWGHGQPAPQCRRACGFYPGLPNPASW